MIKVFKKTILFILLMNVNAVFTEGEIGVASAVNKNTTDLTLAEERRLIQAGYKIIQNHTLETDAIGRAALLLIDGTSFSIGPNSSVTLDKFIYNPETAEGSLEVSSRGLLRLVGGKVTKKRPALIRTNSATVGIRGGITIVQTQGLSTSAAFVYGDELTMTPNQNSSAATSLTENGFIVTVEDPTAEVGDPEQLSETFLAELQKGLEARENDEESDGDSTDENLEEESSEEESTEEESTEEESTEEESTEEEATEEESNQEQSQESEQSTPDEKTSEEQEESTTEENNTSDNQGQNNEIQQENSEEQSQEPDQATLDENVSVEQEESTTEENNNSDIQDQNNEIQQENSADTESESGTDNGTAQADISSDSGSRAQTSDQPDTTTAVDDDPQPDVDESALDSSGVSDNSSDIAPSELSTSDDVVETEIDIDTTSDEVEETAEETEEASETSIEDNAAVETTETVVEEAPFDALLSNENIQLNENETDINLTSLITNKDDDVEVVVTIDGDDKDSFLFDTSSRTLIFIGNANYEDKTNFSLSLIVQREDEEVVIPVNISVRDINEAPSVSTEIQDSYAEDLSVGSVLVGVTISDPENQEVTYSISGEGSDKFSIDESGNITLAESFDFEAKASYTLTVTATDGELSSETEVLINVGDINEAPSLSSTLALTSFSEDSAIGTIIATSSASDPESNTITYSLTGTGSEYFYVDEKGNVTIKDTLDFETNSNYEITLVASDGELTSSSVITFDISDVDEAPSLSSSLKSESFEESIAVGTALAAISSIDPESQTITYSLSGTDSENFEIDSEGNITSKVAFDYETQKSYTFNITASDGTNSTTSPLTITLSDVNESPDIKISLQGSEFAENITTGSTIATVAYTDPESDTLTYTLSGTGSDQFSVDDQGVITLKTGLDYETKTSYELTLTSSDGTNSVQTQISFSVTDISELSLSLDSTEVTLAENISTGTSVAIASSSDAAGEVTYSITDLDDATSESNIFSIDSQGKITLESALDFESKDSYTLAVSASDGKETKTKQLTITVSDINLSYSGTLESQNQNEDISIGTTIVTSSASNSEGTVSYSLTDDDSKFSIDSSTGEVTLSSALDYETKTSHSFTVTATDGVTTSSETFTLNVGDAGLSLSGALAQSSQQENISTGTSILTSSTSESKGTVSYSITDADNKFSINSSTGEVTLSSALDYETKTSHSFTVTATDGVTTSSETFTLNVGDAGLSLSGALAQSSQQENISTGTSILTSSTSESKGTVSYSLTDSNNKFSIDSATGEVTLASALDYESNTSYSFTVTATDGVTTTSETFTLNVTDVDLSVTSSLASENQAETISTGTSILTLTTSNAEGTLSYSITDADNKFAINSSTGEVTLANSLDHETKTSHSFTVTVTDGTTTSSETFTLNVTDVDLSLSSSLAASSQQENISTGTTIATSSASNNEGTVSYTLADADNKFSINSSTGEVTLSSALDYETKTSHSFTVTASDGVSSESQTFTLQVSDIDLSISASLASASQTEGITTGTIIVSAPTASNAEGTVTYSLTDADNKFAVNSSTGAVTLANNLDFETKTSHTFTLTASDGTTTTSQTFTLNVTDVDLANLITSLASTTLSEGASTGASVASVSSIENDTGSSLTYSITAGNSDGKFTVNSSTGAITTAAGLSFKDAKSYTLTLTASGGGETTSTNVVVPIQNSEDLASASVRFSTAYHSASRNGFSATATRGPSGSSMSNYVLEQATNDGGNLLDVSSSNGGKDTTNNYVQAISQDTNQKVDIQYWFPLVTANNAYQGTFAGSANTPDTAKIVDSFNSSNNIDIALSEILYGGQDSTNENFYFMQLDKDETSLSVAGSIDMLVLASYMGEDTSNLKNRATAKGINVTYSYIRWNGSVGWPTSTSPMAAYYDTLSDYEIIWDNRLADNGFQSGTRPIWEGEQERIEAWAADPGSLAYAFVVERCCGRDYAQTYITNLISDLGGSITFDGIRDVAGGSNSSLTLPTFYDGIKNHDIADASPGNSTIACTGCTLLYPKGSNRFAAAYFRSQDLESGTTADIFQYSDIQVPHSSSNSTLHDWFLDSMINKHGANQIYQSFQDQFIFAGNIFKESHWGTFANNLGDGDKSIMAGVMIPIRNFSAGTEYFYPNFIPSNAWSDSYGDVGLTYNANTGTSPEDWAWVKEAQNGDASTGSSSGIQSCRFRFTDTCSGENINEVPEGQSLFWQLFQRTNSTTRAPKIGLWAQISFKDSYDGASGSTTRDDQQSLFSVLIADYDYRKNDTTRYSAGDTNYALDGYHYWSYQDPTNADDNSKALIYGTSPVECVTTRESGCWYSGTGGRPQASLLTPSDPYSSEDMKLSVFYNANTGNFDQGTFAQASMTQNIAYSVGGTNARVESIPISYPRNTRFYDLNNSSNYQGFFSGILEFHDSGKSQLASMRSSSTLASFSFDEINDLVQVTAPLSITSAPANNYTSTWSSVDTGAMTVKFGDANNTDSKSAYISKEIFGAEIQDDGSQIDGSSGGSGNLAGAMVSFNTIEVADSDLFHNNGNDPMPDTEYSTWGFWAMSAADISPNSGDQNASVHLGTWVGGDLVDQSDIPTTGSASMSGAAAVNVAYRHNQTGTNYDVHKYTTTADVAASFNWGASGYSGTLDFTNFDDKNPIVANAGFASFSVAITGTNNTYTGTSTDSLDNSWLGGAAVAGALFGDDSPKESGGRINVNLYKSGATGIAGANDFYMAEGIYLICASGGC